MKTLIFADHGQDFLEWDIDDSGVITSCRPFQDWLWAGKKVIEPELLLQNLLENEEAFVRVQCNGSVISIRYPVISALDHSPRKLTAGAAP